MKTTDDYLELLKSSFKFAKSCKPEDEDYSVLEFLGEEIFGFCTYDGIITEEFAVLALDVAKAINTKTTFEYIENPNGYRGYLLMMNLPFFAERTMWGGSIRGAWWDVVRYGSNGSRAVPLESCGLFDGDKQIGSMVFTEDEWKTFIDAILLFSAFETVRT